MFVNCTLWTLYGLLKNDFSLIVTNVTGSFAGVLCTVIYVYYAKETQETSLTIA